MTSNRAASMIASRGTGGAAIAALAVLGLIATLWSGPARTADGDSAWRAQIDLGVDVNAVEKTSAVVRTFLAGLNALTQGTVISACDHYVETPGAIIGSATLTFCGFAVGQ